MDEQQRQAFENAVEKKKAAAKAASEQPGHDTPGGTGIDRLAQDSLVKDNTPQDINAREKSSGHGHVTAENWNQ